MNKDFVSFEIAKKLKEKGFIEECFARYYCSDKAYFERNSYNPNTESVFYCYNNDEDLGRFYIDAPTTSQVLNWLRKEKKIHIGIIFTGKDYTAWVQLLNGNESQITIHDCDDNTEAEIAGIEYVLDNLI